MEKNQRSIRSRSQTGRGVDLLLMVLLFVAGVGARWPYIEAMIPPGGDEPAFYLTTAENLLSGRGLEVDALWSYQIPFPTVTHPSHEDLMPLPTGLIAASLAIQRALAGVEEIAALMQGQMASQAPGLILVALLAPLTYLVGRRSLPGRGPGTTHAWRGSRWISLAAALLVVANAALGHEAASASSGAPFAFFAAWALVIAVRKPGDEGGYFGLGLLIGLACLTRVDGLVLLLAVPLAWWLLPPPRRPVTDLPDNPAAEVVWEYWPREQGSEREWQRALGPSLTHLVDLGVAFSLLVVPWLVRNYLAFGMPFPNSVLNQLWLTDYLETFNYLEHPTLETWLAQGWQALLIQRGQALLYNGGTFLSSTFPWGILALPGLWLLRREWPFVTPLIYGLLLFFGSALVLPISVMAGVLDAAWGALVPFLALAAMYAVQQAARRLSRGSKVGDVLWIAVFLICLVLAGAQIAVTLPAEAERQQAEQEQFQAAADWLAHSAPPDTVIMTVQPYLLNHAGGQPCIALPGAEPLDAAWAAAQQYGARYLVITQEFGNYPRVLQEGGDPRFRLVAVTETTQIYEIGGQP